MRWMRSALALGAALTAQGCVDRLTPVTDATILGRVEESTAAGAAGVAVGDLDLDGGFSGLVETTADPDGSFRVDGVPPDRAGLVVVATSTPGDTVGRVIVHERTRAGAETVVEPITLETTMEALAWARLKADRRTDASSASEVALLLHPDARTAASVLASDEDVAETARGVATAGETLTSVWAAVGTDLDAAARATLLTDAAAELASARHRGTSADAAAEAYAEAALDAWASAGASLDATAVATAAAASTFDGELHGHVQVRGPLVAEAVRLNLKVRRRLAARLQASLNGAAVPAVVQALAEAEAGVRDATTVAELRAALDACAQASKEATVGGVIVLLVPNPGLLMLMKMHSSAEAAVEAASLAPRLVAAGDAEAAANAVADYRARVRAAVDDLLEAAERTDVDAEALTSLYVAAHGGAYVRAG